MRERGISTWRDALGPGLLMAGAAVGVSHLVQSTRAGAEYGLLLIPVVLLACLFKYPFLEFGPRYAAATGEDLLVGFRRIGRWALAAFALVTVGTMFIVLAVVTLVTAGLAGLVLGLDAPVAVISAGILAACVLLLALGNYHGLDVAMKMLMGALAISTLAAVLLGALLMHASGLRFSDSAVGFSAQLVDLYAHNLGEWSRPLIDFATTLSFLSAPLLAWITLRAVTGPHMPAAARPGQGLLLLAWISLAFGVAFSVAWLLWLRFG